MSYNQNSGYGQALINAVHAAVPTFGRIFVVVNSSDTDEENYGRLQEVFRNDPNGQIRLFTSVASAYAAAEENNNDVIVLDGNSSHAVTAMLDVSKSRVHFVGLDWLLGARRRYGQSSKIAMGVTAAATDIGVVKNTGIRNSFRGIKFTSANTVAQSLYCFVEGGEYTYIANCEMYKSTDLDEAGAAELVMNGDSAHVKDCWIGSTADATVGAIIRANVLVTAGVAGAGKVARDVTFEGCVFAKKAGNVAARMVYGANATDVERLMWFKNCLFYNNLLAAADPAQAVAFGSSQTEGSVVLQGCATVSCTKPSTTTGVFVADPASAAAGGLVTQGA